MKQILGQEAKIGEPAKRWTAMQALSKQPVREVIMPAIDLSAELLRTLLDYNPETGVFVRKVRTSSQAKVGVSAGTIHPQGYRKISLLNHTYSAHRLAWLYVHGVWPQGEIDHRNGDKSDNRFENLRSVSVNVNRQNLVKAHRRNKTGMLGVSPTASGKWQATISQNGNAKHLGSFETPEDAHEAYLVAKRRLHPGCTI